MVMNLTDLGEILSTGPQDFTEQRQKGAVQDGHKNCLRLFDLGNWAMIRGFYDMVQATFAVMGDN